MITALSAVAAAAEDGFNPFEFASGATFWTWVIFLGSLPFMWKFVFGPITKALADRDQQVVEAARSAEHAREQAEQAVAGAEAEREKARAEAQEMRREAERIREEAQRRADDEAKRRAERFLQKAQEDIAAEKRRALVEIRKEVVDLTIASTGTILRRDVDDEAHRRMVEDFIGSIDERS